MVEILMAFALAGLLGSGLLFARQVRHHVGRWFAALSAFTLAVGFYIHTFHLHMGGMAFFGLLGLAALPLVFGFGVTWAFRELRGRDKLAGFALVLTICATYVALPTKPLGMQLAVFVSRPALSQLVDRVRAGESVDVPTRAGLFVVREVKTKGPVVALVTRDRPSGDSALVHFPPGSRGDADTSGYEALAFYGPMYNLDWNVALGGGWRYQVED